jgi:hypothetical protein
MKKEVYLAGDMLNRGSQLQRAEEKQQLKDLGYSLYVPQDNKEINDKENLNSNEGLAEKIVRHDTEAIWNSDIIVMEAREAALGTCIEMGQIHGMKDMAETIKFMLDSFACCGTVNNGELQEVRDYLDEVINKPVYIHNSDIRRGGNPTETGDRRSYGPHQYLYGIVLALTKGKGYREFEEILGELSGE